MSPRILAIILLTLALTLTAQPPPEAQPITLVQKKVKNIGTDCEDREFHVSFRLPPKWTVERQTRWNDNSEPAATITIRETQSPRPVGLYYRLLEGTQASAPAKIGGVLRIEIGKKINLRTRQGLVNYTISEENCEHRKIGERQALSCLASYSDRSFYEMAEYLTWIRTTRCLAQVWIMSPAREMPEARRRVESVIQSLQIP